MKRDGINYPDKIADLEKDDDLIELLEDFLERDKQSWNKVVYIWNQDVSDEELKESFLDPRGGNALTRDRALLDRVEADPKLLPSIRKKLLSQAQSTVNGKVLPAFYKSKAFAAHHDEKVRGKLSKKTGPYDKMADNMRIRDKGLFRDLMIALEMGEDKKADGLARQVLKKEKFFIDRKEFLDSLRKKQVPDQLKDGGGKLTVDVTPRKLKAMGFSKPDDATLRSHVEKMANGYLSRDQVQVRTSYRNIVNMGEKHLKEGDMINAIKKTKAIH